MKDIYNENRLKIMRNRTGDDILYADVIFYDCEIYFYTWK